MDWFSPAFLSALFAIIVIDLALAGDNAIVVALAARNVPGDLRRKAVIWGTVGAIVVRCVLTLIVVSLLQIPGLLAIGGVLLIWIAYGLLAEGNREEHDIEAAQSFAGAIKTIIVADTVMGLDNVLAVAGAARGSFVLVVLGLLISVPIMVGGSQLILKWIDRWPAIIYFGGAVLAWTAARMITHEKLLAPIMAGRPWLPWAIDAMVIAGVLGAGYAANRARRRVREARPPL